MKLPNGYGSVTKLSGNRRKPYLARVTLGWITDEKTGKSVQNRVPLGTFKTKKDALQALADYGANPYDIQNNNMTLAELYENGQQLTSLLSKATLLPERSLLPGGTVMPSKKCT